MLFVVFFGLILMVRTYSFSECGVYIPYYVDDFECDYYASGVGCYELDSEYYCLPDSCLYGYHWIEIAESGACVNCDDTMNAKTCDSDGISTSCWDGFYLNNITCEECDLKWGDTCLTCDDNGCLTCSSNSAICGNGEAILCSNDLYTGYDTQATSCTCSGSDLTVTSCVGGYGLTTFDDGMHEGLAWCVHCGNSAYDGYDVFGFDCTLEASIITITECLSRACKWYDDVSGYEQCNYVGSPVLTCEYDGTDYTALTCDDGYSPCLPLGETDTGCYGCGSSTGYIKTCTFSDTACSVVIDYTCDDNSVDNGVDDCVTCDAYCVDCVWDAGENDASCQACVDDDVELETWETGYFIDESSGVGVCTSCGIRCHDCVNATFCTECITPKGNPACYYIEQPDDTDDDLDDDQDDDDHDDDIDDDVTTDGALGWNVIVFF